MLAIVEPEIESYSPFSYKAIIDSLSSGGYDIKFRRLRKKLKKKRAIYYKYPVLNPDELSDADLFVVFSPYATSHKAKKWSRQYSVKLLHLEAGFFYKSALCDIGGFWGEASVYPNIKSILKNIDINVAQTWADKYRHYIVSNNISKRKQENKHTNKTNRFVFLPMQYMDDQSVLRFGSCPYPRFMKEVARFCKTNDLDLFIKRHPHAYRKEPKDVNRIVKRLKRIHSRTFIVDGSIHWYCQNCRVMAGMNTGAISDGLINKTIMTHCGQSIFEKSGSVIHNNDIQQGLQDALDLDDKNYIYEQQSRMLYFLYHRYLLLGDTPFDCEMTNKEKVDSQLGLL